MRKRLEALKKDQKGFTLVELIVVLVILAILAALLVPALLGYIDRAKEAKYFEEARSIYTALQVINDERYAKTGGKPISISGTDVLTENEKKEIENMISPTHFVSLDAITYSSGGTSTSGKKTDHASFTINSLTIKFESQEGGGTKTYKMESGTWEEVKS